MTAKEKGACILAELARAEANIAVKQYRGIVVRLSYELFCELVGKTQLITGLVGYQQKFAGHNLEVYPGNAGEQSYSIYYVQAEGRFEGERR